MKYNISLVPDKQKLDLLDILAYTCRWMGRVAKETFSGMKWMMLQKMTLQPLQLVFTMFLARLVTPEEIGILGLTAIFFAIAGCLADCGFGTALIRKQDRTEEDINTLFWFNAGMSLLLAGIIYACAPLFVDFFNQPALLWLTRASACMMFFNSLGSVHFTLYRCRRDFKTPALIQTIVAILSMPLCIGLAFAGWGSWAIMTQGIFSGLCTLVVIWIVSPWKPKLIFSTKSFKEMFGYGSKLALSGMLDTGFMNVRSLIIGRFYTPADLAYYDRGRHLAAVLPTTVCGMLGSVTFPILSTLQDDPERLRQVYRKYLRLFTLTITWGCLCITAYSRPFVAVMYGSKWEDAVIYTQLMAFGFAIQHIHVINLNLLSVLGRSDLFLRLEVIKKILALCVMIYCATISVVAMCMGAVTCSYICLLINTYYSRQLIKLSLWRQLMDYTPLFILAFLTTWIPAWFIMQIPVLPILQLIIGGLVSSILYFSILYLTKNDTLNDVLLLLQPRVPTRVLKRFLLVFIRP